MLKLVPCVEREVYGLWGELLAPIEYRSQWYVDNDKDIDEETLCEDFNTLYEILVNLHGAEDTYENTMKNFRELQTQINKEK